MTRSDDEIILFDILSIFFKKFKFIKNKFLNNNSLKIEFENKGFNSLIVWEFIEMKLQQEWAKTFSFFCQQSNIDKNEIKNQYTQMYSIKYLRPLLYSNSKVTMRKALEIYKNSDQENIIVIKKHKKDKDNLIAKKDSFISKKTIYTLIIIAFNIIAIFFIFYVSL